jgi:dTDP-4-amino-4,6-dideoxygalactose transaminase
MAIAFIDLAAQQLRIKDKLDATIQKVLSHGGYIMGPEVKQLEAALAQFCGSRFVLGCANGTDALQLALMALGIKVGDAVFCPSFTFASTAEVVPFVGATPVMVDVDPVSFNMDVESLKRAIVHARELGLRPACIIPVDLFGLPADYDSLIAVAKEANAYVIADSAQGFGATYRGRITGSIGDIATTSFFPAKPLGCYGDGGALFTDDEALRNLLDSYRIHGKGSHKYDNERIGLNSRLDTLQAAVLLEKLAIYADEIDARQKVAQRYEAGLSHIIDTPVVPSDCTSVWAQYTLKVRPSQNREAILGGLSEKGIPAVVYYPRPLHMQTAYADFPRDPAGLTVSEALAQSVFSLPMHPYLQPEQQDQIIQGVRSAISSQA